MLILQMKLPESSNGVEDTAGNNWEIDYEKYINDILKSTNPGDISKWINRKFHKLQPFFSYLLKNNNGELDHDRQLAIFNGVCKFINQIDENHCFSYIFNTFPNTSIDNYCDKTVGEQFSQLVWGKNRDNDGMPEGGSCHYRTLLLYNFFNQLKELGLDDLKIKFFRFKNPINDKNDKEPYERKHSGLIITFQGKHYLVDQSKGKNIISSIESIIEKLEEECEEYKKFEERLKKSTCSEPMDIDEVNAKIANINATIKFYKRNFVNVGKEGTNDYLYFDTPKDFIYNINEYPPNKEMSFYLKLSNQDNENKNEEYYHINFSFVEGGIFIVIDKKGYIFKFDVDKISINSDSNGYNIHYNNVSLGNSLEEICEKLTYVIENKNKHPINQVDKSLLDRVLPFIFKRTDINIIDFFPDSKKYIFYVQERAKIRNRCYNVPYNELKNRKKPTCITL